MKFNKYLKETSGLNPEIKSDVWKNTFTGETCTRWGKYWKTLISFSVGIFNNFIIKYNMIDENLQKTINILKETTKLQNLLFQKKIEPRDLLSILAKKNLLSMNYHLLD